MGAAPDSFEVTFSLVTPTYNRPAQLARYLESLTQLDYPRERFEVVVVDDGGDADLTAIADRFRDRLQLQLLKEPHGGVARSRDIGARAARGKYLAFTDDDCMPATDWLRRLEEALERNPNSAVGGRTVNALVSNPYSEASQAVIRYLYEWANGSPSGAAFFTGNNSCFPRDLYLEVGGLDRGYAGCGEDRDLCARWRDRGYRLFYVPEAVVYHAHPMGLLSFLRKHFRYGRGARRYHRDRVARRSRGMGFGPPSFYLLLPLAAFQYHKGRWAALISVLILLSQVAHSLGFAAGWLQPRQKAPRWQPDTAL